MLLDERQDRVGQAGPYYQTGQRILVRKGNTDITGPEDLAGATVEFEDNNPLCGDVLRVQLKIGEDGTVEDVRFDGHGCAISQAAASMASDEVKGMKVDDVIKLDRDFVLELLGIDRPPQM